VYRVNRLAGHAFAVDLGGTKLRAAVTDVVGEILAERTVPTPHDDLETLVSTIVDLYRGLRTETNGAGGVAAACIGIPGVVQEGGHHIESAFNLLPLEDSDISIEIERRIGLPVIIENDVNLAAVGERWKGAGRETDNFVAVSIGTGIGMGIVVDGELYRGGRGAAGEIGFLPVGDDPFDPDVVQHGGPLEAAAAARGIRRLMLELAADHPTTTLSEGSTVRDIFAAAGVGDPLAQAVIDAEARMLAMAIAGVTAVLDPRLVVLGGGIGANPLLSDPVRAHLARLVPNPPHIETSALNERASLEGAIALALHRIRGELLGPVEFTSVRGDP
jgi:predicted NBD/HSP70 family sugar kinase